MAQLSYTVPFTLVHAGKYRTEEKLKIQTIHKPKHNVEQKSPAIADKPARRESLPKLLQFGVPSTLSLTILA